MYRELQALRVGISLLCTLSLLPDSLRAQVRRKEEIQMKYDICYVFNKCMKDYTILLLSHYFEISIRIIT